MKKLLLAVFLLTSSSPAFAKFSSTVTIANDYNWRGRSLLPKATPATQGLIEYDTDFGLGAYVWMSNIVFGYEVIPEIHYTRTFGDWSVLGEVQNYTFPHQPNANTLEIGGNVAAYGARLWVNYNPKHLGSDTTDLYLNLSYVYAVQPTFNVLGAVGKSTFGDEKKVGMTNYMDYKVGVQYHKDDYMVEMAFTDTDRQEVDALGGKTAILLERRPYVSFSKTF